MFITEILNEINVIYNRKNSIEKLLYVIDPTIVALQSKQLIIDNIDEKFKCNLPEIYRDFYSYWANAKYLNITYPLYALIAYDNIYLNLYRGCLI